MSTVVSVFPKLAPPPPSPRCKFCKRRHRFNLCAKAANREVLELETRIEAALVIIRVQRTKHRRAAISGVFFEIEKLLDP